jgi:hypothetical protein
MKDVTIDLRTAHLSCMLVLCTLRFYSDSTQLDVVALFHATISFGFGHNLMDIILDSDKIQ